MAYFTKQKTLVFKCDCEVDMASAREKALQENPGYSIIKEKKDFKTKKLKGEIIDEYWLYAVTLDYPED